jgi:mannosyltransferase OCH1-like enzyme
MSNRVIQSLWIGNELSNNELLCLQSFIYHHHEFHLYTYNEISNIPPGVVVKDANDIIPVSRLFKDTYDSYASFSDWFRLKLLFQKGGWWVDMDIVCLRSFDLREEYCFSSEWNDVTNGKAISNTCIKSSPGAPHIGELIEIIESKLQRGKPVSWGELSVFLWRSTEPVIEEAKKHMVDPAVFCPINYFELSRLITADGYVQEEQTLAVHLWNELWRRGYLNKNARYHPDSIYEQLKRKYLSAIAVAV